MECNENEERVVLRLQACFGLHRAQLHVYLFLCFIFKHTYKTIKHASKTRNKQWASENFTALKKLSCPDCHTLPIRGLNNPPHAYACEGGNTRTSSPSSRAPRAFLCALHNSYAPTTKGRTTLDKNSYPSGNQCFTIWDSKVANKLTKLCGGRLVYLNFLRRGKLQFLPVAYFTTIDPA